MSRDKMYEIKTKSLEMRKSLLDSTEKKSVRLKTNYSNFSNIKHRETKRLKS